MALRTNRRLRIFTWHVHGNYLYYLSQSDHEFLLPVRPERRNPYGGRGDTFAFGPNVREIPAEEIAAAEFDAVLFQSATNYTDDQYEILTPEQRRLPRIFL